MEKIITAHPVENFIKPEPLTTTKPIINGQVIPGENHEILYYVDKNNPLGDPPQNPALDPQYLMWEVGVENWLKANP